MPTFFFSYWKFVALSVPWRVPFHGRVPIHYFIVKFQKCSISYRNWTHIIFRQETRWNYQFLTKMVFCALKMEILCFRYNKGMVTCWPPVIAIGPLWMSIIFYHQGQLLVQRRSQDGFPFLRSWGGGSSHPLPLPCMAKRLPYEALRLVLLWCLFSVNF